MHTVNEFDSKIKALCRNVIWLESKVECKVQEWK